MDDAILHQSLEDYTEAQGSIAELDKQIDASAGMNTTGMKEIQGVKMIFLFNKIGTPMRASRQE